MVDQNSPTDDARRFPQDVSISWWFAGGKLRGWIAAVTTNTPISAALSSYAELTRQ
ncbi:MAG TPA: hypothetical protein VHE82_00195 [Gemmatimonadaceae bacterium]|nr:hypothetical protein [Gemmatimonadaceae bacterium]